VTARRAPTAMPPRSSGQAAPQTWDPQRYAKNARFVSELGAPVVDLLAPQSGERILDLGCGDGALTREFVARGCEVVGVDSSAAQVEAARALGLDARVVDGANMEFEAEFDAVFSNASLHWMRRADDVLGCVHRALKPGGRFVAEFGGHGCVDAIRSALVRNLVRRGVDGESRVPWYFPTPGDYATRLERVGFRVDLMMLFPRPTPLPGDILPWLETFAESFTSALPEDERDAYLREVADELEPKLKGASGQWVADYVRLRFAATKI
jgi:trans-aconitate methyltransferase